MTGLCRIAEAAAEQRQANQNSMRHNPARGIRTIMPLTA